MTDLLDGLSGVRLTEDAYDKDFDDREATLKPCELWKLERRQHFREPGGASWEAFARGDWDDALHLIEAGRDALKRAAREAAEHRSHLTRVRVVERPITPYLQWELYALRLHAEYGEHIRVIGPGLIREYEARGPLPEIITLGPDAFYEILYDEDGVCEGAVRYLGADGTARVVEFIRRPYDAGEDLGTYFDREVARLEPPHGG